MMKQTGEETQAHTSPPPKRGYYPLSDTFRLYAGWLLAWYFVIYAVGLYQETRPLPFRISFIENLFFSPLILTLTSIAFLFLLLSSLYRLSHKKKHSAVLLTILGIILFVLFRANT